MFAKNLCNKNFLSVYCKIIYYMILYNKGIIVMEKEKFLNIQSKLPDAIAYYSQNKDEEMLFFGPKHNPFFADFSSSKKYLKNKIEKDINLLTHFDEKVFDQSKLGDKYMYLKDKYTPQEAMMQFKNIKELELDYLLYVNYALELMHGENLFQINPPFTDNVVKNLIWHREKNFDKYKKMFVYYAQGIKKNSIFVDEDRTIKNIVKDNFGNAIIADERMLLDKKLQNKLAYNVKKYPLTDTLCHTEKNNYDYYQRYYVGKYKGQYVLFSEVSRISKKQKGKKQEYSYQLNLVANGDPNKNRILYRIDCNFGANHINKIEGRNLNIANKENVDIEKLRHHNVKNCHIHMPNSKYAIIFPNYIHSCDAKEYEFEFKDFDKFIEFNKNLIKTENTTLISKFFKSSLKNNKPALKLKLNSFLEDCFKEGKKADSNNCKE